MLTTSHSTTCIIISAGFISPCALLTRWKQELQITFGQSKKCLIRLAYNREIEATKMKKVWRAMLEAGFIIFLFYSNLLMGELEHSG